MKMLSERMADLLSEYKRSGKTKYNDDYIDGVMDMYNEAKRYIQEAKDEKTNKLSDTQTDKASDTGSKDRIRKKK